MEAAISIAKPSRMKRFFALFCVTIILVSCGSPKKKEIKRLNPVSVKSLVNDLSIGSHIRLTCTDSALIVVGRRTDKISIFNYKTLTAQKVIGRAGRGPGEFNRPVYAAADSNKIYIADAVNHTFTVFNSDDWSLDTTIAGRLITGTRFIASGGYLYFFDPMIGDPAPFVKMDVAGHKPAMYFGKWVKPDEPVRAAYFYNLLLYHHTIIVVSQIKPVIKFYNEKGKLISLHNLSNDKDLSNILAYKRQFKQNPANRNKSVILFYNAGIYKNYLILNFDTRPHGKLKTNNYLVYKIDGNHLSKVGVFEIDIHDGYIDTFCIHRNKLYIGVFVKGIHIFVFDLSFLNKI